MEMDAETQTRASVPRGSWGRPGPFPARRVRALGAGPARGLWGANADPALPGPTPGDGGTRTRTWATFWFTPGVGGGLGWPRAKASGQPGGGTFQKAAVAGFSVAFTVTPTGRGFSYLLDEQTEAWRSDRRSPRHVAARGPVAALPRPLARGHRHFLRGPHLPECSVRRSEHGAWGSGGSPGGSLPRGRTTKPGSPKRKQGRPRRKERPKFVRPEVPPQRTSS